MTPIRRLLLRNSLVLLIAGVGGLLAVSWWSLRVAMVDQGATQARASLQNMDQELLARLEQAENLCASLTSLWERGVLSPGRDQTTPSVLLSLLQRESLIPVVMLLNEEGDGVLADRRTGPWSVSLLHREGSRTEVREGNISPQGRWYPISAPYWVDADYRQRPWYLKAASDPKPAWTSAYRFQRLHALGVSYPKAVRKDGRLIGVVDVDLLLDDLSQLIWNTRPTMGTTAALTDETGRTLVLPRGVEFSTTEQRDRAFLQPLSASFLPQLYAASTQEKPSLVRVDGERYFTDRHIVEGPLGVRWQLQLAIPYQDLLGATEKRLSIGLGIALGIVGAMAWWMWSLTRRLADPLINLTGQLDALRKGEVIDPPHSGVLELDRLGGALRTASQELIEKRGLENTLRQTQRIELMGTMAAGIAHDANNQLTAIRGQIEMALLHLKKGLPIKEVLERAEEATMHAGDIMQALFRFARGEHATKVQPVDVKELIERVAELLRHSRAHAVRIECVLGHDIPKVLANPVQLEQVLLNLGLNGIDAMPKGGVLALHAQHIGGQVCLQVRDSGTGMSQDVMNHLFQAFFTTKEAGKGTGLGLAMVQSIAKAHGGRIEVETSPGRGSTFSIWLPPLENGLPLGGPTSAA
jgi:signal transduction histidine kinase